VSATAREGQQSGATASLLARLEALAERHYHHRHPFTALEHAGRLDRDELRVWVANRYYHETRLPLADALIVAKSEDPAFRRFWVQRLLDRDGRSDPRESAPTEPGRIELWLRLAAAFGLGSTELASGAAVSSDVRVACDEYVERVRAADLVTAVASSLTEYFAWRLVQARIDAWREHYAFIEERALECFRRTVDRGHRDAERALAFVQAHATTPEREQRCLEAFIERCALSWRLLDATYFACRRRCVPFVESRVWLMRLSALASDDGAGPEVAPGVLMAPGRRGLSLNHTAYALLARFDGRRTLEQIVVELADQHAVAPERVARDVTTFVGELERRHLVSFCPAG
jgi:pyrroloquinoline-quinone synthase